MARRDKRALYIYCPRDVEVSNPIPGGDRIPVPDFPFFEPDEWCRNQGVRYDEEDLIGNPPNFGNRDPFSDWAYVCVVDATNTGGTTTSDASDRCDTYAETVEATTHDISGTINLVPTRTNGYIDEMILFMCAKYERCVPFFLMMLDCTRNTPGAQGRWIYGTLKSWNETQGLNQTTQITFNFTPEPLPLGYPNTGKVICPGA